MAAVKRSTAMITAGVLAVLTAVLVLLLVLQLASSPKAKVKLGPDVFDAGPVDKVARTIDAGGPLGFRDPVNGQVNIWIDHLGAKRFVAVEDDLPGGCRLELDRKARVLRNSCTKATVDTDPPPTTSYTVRIDSREHLLVDLRLPHAPAP
jgi:hypothetical protein